MATLRPTTLALLALLASGTVSAATVSYDFTLKATTPNPEVPGTYQPFGFNSATPAQTFQAHLSYEVTGNVATLLDFDLTIGNQSWTESPQQTFLPTLNPDGTLAALFFRADSDGNAQNAADWTDIVEIMVNFGPGQDTFWRAFEGNCLVGANIVFRSCIQGLESDGGISYRVVSSVPEPATAWLGLLSLGALAASRRRRG